jgi:hypothetical protein
MENTWKAYIEACDRLGIKPSKRVLLVDIPTQTMRLFREGVPALLYAVSTSRRPPCNVRGSLGTPTGLHEISERIGAGAPPGMVFKARVPTGHHVSELSGTPEPGGGHITARILWLSGLEPGVNLGGEVDTKSRYVYLHGTSLEAGIGSPQSGGCVLMRDLDIVALYEEVRVGDHVWIQA